MRLPQRFPQIRLQRSRIYHSPPHLRQNMRYLSPQRKKFPLLRIRWLLLPTRLPKDRYSLHRLQSLRSPQDLLLPQLAAHLQDPVSPREDLRLLPGEDHLSTATHSRASLLRAQDLLPELHRAASRCREQSLRRVRLTDRHRRASPFRAENRILQHRREDPHLAESRRAIQLSRRTVQSDRRLTSLRYKDLSLMQISRHRA